jgi:Na+/phosphate symporter
MRRAISPGGAADGLLQWGRDPDMIQTEKGAIMKATLSKELVSKLYNMSQSAVECIYLLQNAFLYNSEKSLDVCEGRAREIRLSKKVLTQEFIEEAKAEPYARLYVSVPGHIERMGGLIEDIIGCIRTKIRDGILFSGKAVSETSFLMERLQEVLKNASDIILARNVILKDYVKESAAEISRSASEFATMHEERLVEGLCMPKASPLFLDILDAIKGIAWHAKEMSEKLTPA